MPSDRELEETIDAAIMGYSEVAPSLGLEQRIIARSLAERGRHLRFAWQWILATLAAACVLAFLFLAAHSRLRKSVESAAQSNTIVAIPTRAIPSPPAVASALDLTKHFAGNFNTKIRQSHLPYPKQDVFPSPTPPTAEEQSMMAFSRSQFQMPQATPADIQIPSIRIAELQIKSSPSIEDSSNSATNPQSPPAVQQP